MGQSDETPVPLPGGPTPADVLTRVAAAGGVPWFPSEYALTSGVGRDSLNDPLNDLRNAGLITILDWVKGKGQGYGVTPDGEKAAADPDALTRALAAERTPPTPADVPVAHPELAPAETRDPAGLTTFDRGELARQALFDPPPPVVTPVLILANLVWFAVGVVVAWRSEGAVGFTLRGWEGSVLLRIGGVSGDSLLNGDWWRLISACFVHAGGVHLVLNLYALGVIGPVAEGLWGRWRFALIYAWAGLAGNCLAMAVHPDVLVAGASGAVWGVMAAVGAWVALHREHLPPELVLGWARTLWVVLLVNIVVSFAPRVSWEAHLGGAAVGFAAAVLAQATRPGLVRRPVLVPAAVALGLVPVGCLLGLAVAMDTGDEWHTLRERAVARLLRPIGAAEVDAAYRGAIVWGVTDKPPKGLLERVRRLHTDADAARDGIARVDGFTDRHAAELAYAAAVADFAAALDAVAAAPAPPSAATWELIGAKKRYVDRTRLELGRR
jgi:membrane associated rhomboid family serine protease